MDLRIEDRIFNKRRLRKKINLNNMKNKRYADGYLPKIAYHISQSNRDKVDYFTERHEAKYGKLTASDISKVIDMVVEMNT